MRISPRKTKQNRYQRAEARRLQLEAATTGTGVYVFRNRMKGDLYLLKPAADGRKIIPPGGEFTGDSYFMSLVNKSHEAVLVKVIKTPEQQMEEKMQQEKLIVDQPDRITTAGKVEQVVVGKDDKKVKLNETVPTKAESEKQPDVLLVGDAVDGVEIIN